MWSWYFTFWKTSSTAFVFHVHCREILFDSLNKTICSNVKVHQFCLLYVRGRGRSKLNKTKWCCFLSLFFYYYVFSWLICLASSGKGIGVSKNEQALTAHGVLPLSETGAAFLQDGYGFLQLLLLFGLWFKKHSFALSTWSSHGCRCVWVNGWLFMVEQWYNGHISLIHSPFDF